MFTLDIDCIACIDTYAMSDFPCHANRLKRLHVSTNQNNNKGKHGSIVILVFNLEYPQSTQMKLISQIMEK